MLQSFLDLLNGLTDPSTIINTGGLLLVLVIVFAENGVFFGFFLPGDTLLFTAGILCGTGKFDVNIITLITTIIIAGSLGSIFGYWFGHKTGKALLNKKESIFFKRKYLEAAEAFFNRWGGMALVMGKFLPIIRTFAPIFAGIINFDKKRFFIFNSIGVVAWGFIMTMIGFTLGVVFPSTKDYLESIIMGIVVITWIPVIITYIKEQRRKNANT